MIIASTSRLKIDAIKTIFPNEEIITVQTSTTHSQPLGFEMARKCIEMRLRQTSGSAPSGAHSVVAIENYLMYDGKNVYDSCLVGMISVIDGKVVGPMVLLENEAYRVKVPTLFNCDPKDFFTCRPDHCGATTGRSATANKSEFGAAEFGAKRCLTIFCPQCLENRNDTRKTYGQYYNEMYPEISADDWFVSAGASFDRKEQICKTICRPTISSLCLINPSRKPRGRFGERQKDAPPLGWSGVETNRTFDDFANDPSYQLTPYDCHPVEWDD